jgi:signal transduction histidine kinase
MTTARSPSTDDGVGVPEATAGSGLHDLAQRARQVGGTRQLIHPGAGGTCLTWTAPLP